MADFFHDFSQVCTSEFISTITSEAGSHCAFGSRRHLDGDDILWALTSLGFEHYVEPLQVRSDQLFWDQIFHL
jgi:hypothetical protein